MDHQSNFSNGMPASATCSLSPFQHAESPSGSSFTSPRHSAIHGNKGQKRALSISPNGSEGMDLTSLIRTSPTSLVAYINGSRSSSTSVSPQPSMHQGHFGHLIAHRARGACTINSASASSNMGMGHSIHARHRANYTPQSSMYKREPEFGLNENLADIFPDIVSNQVVVQQSEVPFVEQKAYQERQLYGAPQTFGPNPVGPMHTTRVPGQPGGHGHNVTNNLAVVGRMPPSYDQAVGQNVGPNTNNSNTMGHMTNHMTNSSHPMMRNQHVAPQQHHMQPQQVTLNAANQQQHQTSQHAPPGQSMQHAPPVQSMQPQPNYTHSMNPTPQHVPPNNNPSHPQQQQQQQHQPLTQLNNSNIVNNNNSMMETNNMISENSFINNNNLVNDELELDENGEKQHICRWIDCNNLYKEQDELVRHIEKAHIDQRKGEEFTCFWAGCQRQYKPFNARYKLLIHMRVHSGEKPNKCTVSKSHFHIMNKIKMFIVRDFINHWH